MLNAATDLYFSLNTNQFDIHAYGKAKRIAIIYQPTTNPTTKNEKSPPNYLEGLHV